MEGVAGNMTTAGLKVLSAGGEVVPVSSDLVSAVHNVVPAGWIL
jgi:hypothetical protein